LDESGKTKVRAGAGLLSRPKDPDADIPILKEARAAYAKLSHGVRSFRGVIRFTAAIGYS